MLLPAKFIKIVRLLLAAVSINGLIVCALDSLHPDWCINPLMLKCSSRNYRLLCGSMLLLTITWKSRIILQNIWRRVVDSSLINISPSNIFLIFLLLERYHHNYQAVLAATGMHGLILRMNKSSRQTISGGVS